MTGRRLKNARKTVVPSTFGQRIFASLKKLEMLRPGERVGVAVSGGADSVALLLLLLELQEKLGIVLSVVHFNHKLRGKASDADEAFVANWPRSTGWIFTLLRSTLPKRRKTSGLILRTRRDGRGTTISVRWWNLEPVRESRLLTRPTIRRRPCLRICSAGLASRGLAEFIP